jgi:hypothetical protein
MARWVLICPNCNTDFTYTDAPLDVGAFAWSGVKPEFPQGGLSASCPNCNAENVYQRRELMYRA